MQEKNKITLLKINKTQSTNAISHLIEEINNETGFCASDDIDLLGFFSRLSDADFLKIRNNKNFSALLQSMSIFTKDRDDIDANNNESNLKHDLYNIEIDLGASICTTDKCNVETTKEVETFEGMATFNLSQPLNYLQLPDRFLKVIKRIQNSTSSHAGIMQPKTLRDIINLSTYDVESLPGIGLKYVRDFISLKSFIEKKHGSEERNDFFKKNEAINIEDFYDLKLCTSNVEPSIIKSLETYGRRLKIENISERVELIINANLENLSRLPNFGNLNAKRIILLRDLVINEIEEVKAGKIKLENFESFLLAPIGTIHIPLERLEKIILEDIDRFLERIPESDVDIIQRRWGFVDTKSTLEDIAIDHNVTRERIRQKEIKITNSFFLSLRISKKQAWESLQKNLNPEIISNLKQLHLCFSNNDDFFSFIDLICDRENIIETVFPKIEKETLTRFFVEQGAPAHIDDVRELIADLVQGDNQITENAIRRLESLGDISIESDYVKPRNLGKSEATACVLADHRKGLPWLDVAKLVNLSGYSKHSIYEDRLDAAALTYPDYIFLSGKGTYKHTRFMSLNKESVDGIFSDIINYAKSTQTKTFHLFEYYQESEKLKKNDYFEIRHAVKNFGEDFGLYFKGKSSSDSVSLEKEFENITQKELIINSMNRFSKPLTAPEVAGLIKSKSLNHAALYLDTLINLGKVVQVDRMRYTTPSIAYKEISIPDYIDAIETILKKHAKPVEPSIFKEELNPLFSRNFSKYFYSSIARLYAKEKGWNRRYNLYSITEFPYESVRGAVELSFDSNAALEQNIASLQSILAINRESAAVAISNWRNTSQS